MSQIDVDIDGLKYLADAAIKNGTTKHFVPVALQWAEGATEKIAQYRDALDSLEMHACDGPTSDWKMISVVEWRAIFETLK